MATKLHSSISVLIASLILLQIIMVISSQQLTKKNPYWKSCPQALFTIKSGVYKAVLKDRRVGASLLRLHFHDCFVNGCDASVLLDDTPSFTGEKTAAPNLNSLRGFEVIDSIKSDLESLCPGVVSCADVLAVTARDSVLAMGGPLWEVELGRRDSTTASLDNANTDIPSPSLDLPDLISAFSNKGFSPKELVALSGSHTIGEARCTVFRGRIYNETTIFASFAASLKPNCPINGSDDNLSPIDATTPVVFDNAYFKNLINSKGLMHSDQQLFTGETHDHVTAYADNPAEFFSDFAAAMVKMGSLRGSGSGEIRNNCRMIN